MSQHNRILSELSPSQMAAIAPFLVEVDLGVDDVLYPAGGDVDWVYFPRQGVVAVIAIMKDGRWIEATTIGFEGATAIAAALAHAPIHARHVVRIGGSAMRLSASRLREEASNSPALLRSLMWHVQNSIAQSEQSAACNALHSAAQRLARWLLQYRDRSGRDDLRLTQEYLAAKLGVQRTTVTSLANAMKRARLISYRRGSIVILDHAGLEKASCECRKIDLVSPDCLERRSALTSQRASA